MPVAGGSSEDIGNLMPLAYLTNCIIVPLGGGCFKRIECIHDLVSCFFERSPFFQAFKMRSLSKLLVFETKVIGHATAIAALFLNFNFK
jgi:hypothetical protein